MYELYNYRRCPFCIRVRLVFLYKGLPFSQNNEKLRDWSQEFIDLFDAKKPTVPVLLDDGEPVFESLDIMEYINRKHPEPALSEEDFRSWGDWAAGTFRDAVEMYKYGHGGSQEEGQVAVQSLLDELDSRLQNKRFLTGDELALADFALWPFIRQAFRVMPVNISMPENLGHWYDAIEQHEKLKEVMKKN